MSTAFGQRPFRASIAIASGLLTRGDLRSEKWRRLFRDVYVDARIEVTQELLIQGASLRLPDDGIITGRSAAYLWGVRLGSLGDPVEVMTTRRLHSSAGLHVRNGSIDAREVVIRNGVSVPIASHTAWEIARTLPMFEAVPWIDALARARGLEVEELLSHAGRHGGEWGCVPARATLKLCDGRAESPPESVLRARLVTSGVPAPTPQFRIVANRQFLARVDLAWPEIRFAVEYDGQWHADRDQLTRDRRRLRNLNAAGWYIFPVTRDDMRNVDALVRTIGAMVSERFRLL